jgi:hypothetical protein
MPNHRVPLIACDAFADLLVDFSDREIPAEQHPLVASHIASCARCREWLARLDASRDVLASGIQYDNQSSAVPAVSPAFKAAASRATYCHRVQAVLSAAAVLLVLLGAAIWFGKGTWSQTRIAHHKAVAPAREVDVAALPTPIHSEKPRKITPDDALWHVALVEQQARLQASLDLLPRHGPFADQREQDERLLAKFQTLSRIQDLQ